MLRITLTPNQRDAVEALRRDPSLTPADRDRVEMVLLAASGWSVPQIATHFHCCQQTVRRLLHRFTPADLTRLRRQRPGPPPDATRREQVTAALSRLLAQDRTWTAAQLATALRAEGIRLSTRQVRRYLHQLDARWHRTARTLRHKQDPERVAQAKQDLAELKKALRPAS
jgi:putative transposase